MSSSNAVMAFIEDYATDPKNISEEEMSNLVQKFLNLPVKFQETYQEKVVGGPRKTREDIHNESTRIYARHTCQQKGQKINLETTTAFKEHRHFKYDKNIRDYQHNKVKIREGRPSCFKNIDDPNLESTRDENASTHREQYRFANPDLVNPNNQIPSFKGLSEKCINFDDFDPNTTFIADNASMMTQNFIGPDKVDENDQFDTINDKSSVCNSHERFNHENHELPEGLTPSHNLRFKEKVEEKIEAELTQSTPIKQSKVGKYSTTDNTLQAKHVKLFQEIFQRYSQSFPKEKLNEFHFSSPQMYLLTKIQMPIINFELYYYLPDETDQPVLPNEVFVGNFSIEKGFGHGRENEYHSYISPKLHNSNCFGLRGEIVEWTNQTNKIPLDNDLEVDENYLKIYLVWGGSRKLKIYSFIYCFNRQFP